MIISLIFFVHFFFCMIIFLKKWQDENLSSGFMGVSIVALVFAVGWPMVGMITKAIIAQKGLGIFFDRDTITLTLLSLGEFFFYKMYFKDTFEPKETEERK